MYGTGAHEASREEQEIPPLINADEYHVSHKITCGHCQYKHKEHSFLELFIEIYCIFSKKSSSAVKQCQ